MCSTPDIPKPRPPAPPPQAAKAPDVSQFRKRNPMAPLPGMAGGMVGPGLLTGAGGVSPGSLNVGATLLGGGSK